MERTLRLLTQLPVTHSDCHTLLTPQSPCRQPDLAFTFGEGKAQQATGRPDMHPLAQLLPKLFLENKGVYEIN